MNRRVTPSNHTFCSCKRWCEQTFRAALCCAAASNALLSSFLENLIYVVDALQCLPIWFLLNLTASSCWDDNAMYVIVTHFPACSIAALYWQLHICKGPYPVEHAMGMGIHCNALNNQQQHFIIRQLATWTIRYLHLAQSLLLPGRNTVHTTVYIKYYNKKCYTN